MKPPVRLSILIADDEPPAREWLRAGLRGWARAGAVSECENGDEALAHIVEHAPQLVFLDVQMPGISGVELVRRLPRERPPRVVFVTAHSDHSVAAFELCALDYLLKPISGERFRQTLRRVEAEVDRDDAASLAGRLEALVQSLAAPPAPPAPPPPRRLALRDGSAIAFVDVDAILWVEADGNYAVVHTARGDHVVRQPLKALFAHLGEERFARVAHGAIVNIDKIRLLQPVAHGEMDVTLEGGQRLRTSRRYRDELDRILDAVKPR